MDISGFFDNIDHTHMKKELIALLGSETLSDHDYHIFKNMTAYAWIEADQIETRMRGKKPPRGRICSAYQMRTQFRELKPSIIHQNLSKIGIPQGTPLSGLYANIYMHSFDTWAHSFMSEYSGSYRRYSDDIAIIFPKMTDTKAILDRFKAEIQSIMLNINPEKTEISNFSIINKKMTSDTEFQYLGFTFNGEKTLIRSSSLNNYYRKMRSGIYGKIQIAKHKDIPKNEIYLRELYRKDTHYGKSRNFIRYALSASYKMNSQDIRRQVSRHMHIFRETLDEAIRHYYR